jgi:transcriptional regulator with XRE-family HTH domain
MQVVMNNLLKEFPKILLQLRTLQKVTQKEVAKELGIAYQSYQAYEMGITTPRLEHFIKLCIFFDVTPNELLGID